MRVVWLTGRPASGKTSLGVRLVAALSTRGLHATLVDSDEARRSLTPHPRYDDGERDLVYRALAYAARRLADEGIVAVVAATAHTASLRAAARAVAPGLLLVHVDCPAAVCEARDPKGLYAAARGRAEGHLPGVHEAFAPPRDADVVVDASAPIPDAVVLDLVQRIVAVDGDTPADPSPAPQSLRR